VLGDSTMITIDKLQNCHDSEYYRDSWANMQMLSDADNFVYIINGNFNFTNIGQIKTRTLLTIAG